MFFRSRYIHYQGTLPHDKYNGFSVLLSPSDYPDTVDMRYTLCSKHDQFSRKKAREVLAGKGTITLAVKDLPATLTALEFKVWGETYPIHPHSANRWTWVWKYFL